MPVTELRVENYRSIRDLTLPLKRVNIITGPNGCGKSNLYNSMALVRSAAAGELSRSMALQGGIPSAFWAGRRSQGPARLQLGVTVDDYRYDLELGSTPSLQSSAFQLDPQVKSEKLEQEIARNRVKILDRGTSSCKIRNAQGVSETFLLQLSGSESIFDQITDPTQFPQLEQVRRKILKWRFYHGFRVDADSPLRRPQVGVRTWVLSQDGSDVAAALQTIIENGDDGGLAESIEDAFPGATLEILTSGPGVFEVGLLDRGVHRPLRAHELSDGTLRYLCLLAALLSPTPAPLLALNEPESSLHETLLPPLARLIARACASSQIWLTTHSPVLSNALSELTAVKPIGLEKLDGATVREGRKAGQAFAMEDVE